VNPGFGREAPQLRRTASSVASSYKRTISPALVTDELPLHSVTVSFHGPQTVEIQESAWEHQRIPP